MQFYGGCIGRIKTCGDFLQFFTQPKALALKNAKASKYKVLLACIVSRT